MNVAICDYGAGNTRSVEIAFARLGARFTDDVRSADLAVLPGVGSARSAMDELRRQGIDEALRARIAAARPVLGICLGLQLLFESSVENEGGTGLSLLGGVVAPLGPRRSTCSAGILPARWRAGSPLVNEAGPALVRGGRAVFGGSRICLRQRTFRPPSGRRDAGAT